MAEQHGTMRDPIVLVVSEVPDICNVQMGPKAVPTPFELFTHMGAAQGTTPKVLFQELQAFVTRSMIPQVYGNEASAPLGGIKTGRFGPNGVCYVIDGEHTKVVKAQGQLVVRNTSRMWLNGTGPGAPGNSTGVVVFLVVGPPNKVDEGGKPKEPTKPAAKAETAKEGAPAKNEATVGGRSVKPGTLDPKVSPELRREYEQFNESAWRTGTPETGQVDLGNVQYTNYGAVGPGDPAGISGGVGGQVSFATLRAQQAWGGAGQLGQANVDAEFLSAGASGGIKATASTTAANVEGTLGAEVNVAKVTGSAGVRLTFQALYNKLIAPYFQQAARYDPRAAPFAYAPASTDVGVVIGVKGEAGVGAAAEVSGKVGFDAKGEKKLFAETGAKLGAGPMGGVKVFVAIVGPPK